MIRKTNYTLILKVLEQLHKEHPSYNIGRHIATATDSSELWGISDKELLLSLKKYEVALNMDSNHDNDIDEIINDGMHLDSYIDEEEY